MRREIPGEQVSPTAEGIAPARPGEYNALRRRWLEGRCWAGCGEGLTAFQQFLSRSTGGDIYRLDLPGGPGCAAVELDGEDAVVKELLCAPGDICQAVAQLAARHPARRYVLRLPPWTPGDGQRVLWGAVRWLYGRASPWWPEGEGAYLGLAFD